MVFGDDLAAKVLAGEKTVTRRKPGKYRAGRSYSVQTRIKEGPGKGRGGKQLARIAVLSVDTTPLHMVGVAGEAQQEGFDSLSDFIDYWKELYGDFDIDQVVDRIKFKLIDPADYKLWEGGQ